MSKFLPSGRSRLALQFCTAAAVAALMGGCSTDSTRLSDPFSNPFTTASNEPAQPTTSHTFATGRAPPVMSQALPPRQQNVASAAPLRPRLTQAYNAPISRETTGSIEPSPARMARGVSSGGWTSTGGVPVTVAQGDNADVLSKRYGVPTTALLQTNGLRSAADVRPGSNLVIPVYNAAAAAAPARLAQAEPPRVVARPRPLAKAALLKPAAERTAAADTRTQRLVAPTRPVAKVAAAPVKTAPAKLLAERPSSAKTLTAKHEIATGKLTAAKQMAARPPASPIHTAAIKPPSIKTAALAPTPARPAAPAPAQAIVRPDPTPTASVAPASPVADASGNPEFRWPARGRIIQGFKGGNDGINIAVPEGTPVKAAEGGTVAYAGSELKGYGNLVLIRHPNGFVTAYANNGELDVKRGDQVKRGQLIAKSGQSGNVSSPQLHFELRKGSTPVDPTSYLAGL